MAHIHVPVHAKTLNAHSGMLWLLSVISTHAYCASWLCVVLDSLCGERSYAGKVNCRLTGIAGQPILYCTDEAQLHIPPHSAYSGSACASLVQGPPAPVTPRPPQPHQSYDPPHWYPAQYRLWGQGCVCVCVYMYTQVSVHCMYTVSQSS